MKMLGLREINDVIAAVSTPAGSGGISIVRMSGADSVKIADRVFRGKTPLSSKNTHTISYGQIVDPETDKTIDEALVSVMLAPHTYTTENIVEINCHGGMLVTGEILLLLCRMGARLAEPGEFTKRAFLNGRIDLSQAEAVIDIINSKTELQRMSGVERLSGGLKNKIKEIRESLLDLIALIEAQIDYPDEMADENVEDTLYENMDEISQKLKYYVDRADRGKIIRDGIKAVILGRPNVGKSSLMNRLLDEERAIVTDIPGTTRDTLEEFINVDGIPVKLIDTAGVRSTEDEVEKIGVEKSLTNMENADLVLLILDLSDKITAEDEELLRLIHEKEKKYLIILNKTDIEGEFDQKTVEKYCDSGNIIKISAKNDENFDLLFDKIKEMFITGEITKNDEILSGGSRHKEALARALMYVENGKNALQAGLPTDMAFIDLRDALDALGEITGDKADDEVINRIFENFCVGK